MAGIEWPDYGKGDLGIRVPHGMPVRQRVFGEGGNVSGPEAAQHGRQAYRIAWAEGPPNYFYWDLQDARELLDALGEPIPELPVVDPASVTVPFEHKIRALIATIAAER